LFYIFILFPQTKTTLKKYFYFIYKKLQPTRLLVNSSTRQLKKNINFSAERYFSVAYMELTFFFFKPTASVINANYIITCNSFRPQTKTTLKKYFYFI